MGNVFLKCKIGVLLGGVVSFVGVFIGSNAVPFFGLFIMVASASTCFIIDHE